ncbi:hypothetical protein NQV05_00545 [Mycoplasmopsis agalactiae]|uniref:OppA family ABC transporter substrate-binding lipoprotein n=1 Tax=Mycoplasmopsis agalactiae TaxID=2110 RepID=UPI00211BEC21|nr:hypothetical protein [Mycoplasmopsis agalactiae]UUM25633.1 hypothetical protein NQV05_00545 [Mycoplasmopsis agalactiae]
MPTKRNKLFLYLGTSAVGLAAPLVAARCQNDEYQELDYKKWANVLDGKPESLWNLELESKAYESGESLVKNDLLAKGILRAPAPGTRPAVSEYSFDGSVSYGSWQSTALESAQGILLRKEVLFSPIVIKTIDGKFVNARPSVWRYKLELGSKVFVTDDENQVHEFDNDLVDEFPQPDGEPVSHKGKNIATFKHPLYEATSSNAKSINSKQFKDLLKKAKKLQFEVVKGQKWINNKGEATKYEVVPKDFYYSWLRTTGRNVEQREKLLKDSTDQTYKYGEKSAEIDKFINQKWLTQNSTFFTKSSKYSNEYVYQFLSIDSSKFYNEKDFIVDNKLTFNPLTEGKQGSFDLLFEQLATSQDFSAAPSQLLDEYDSDPKKVPAKPVRANPESVAVEQYKKILEDTKGSLASKIGLYWYGFHEEDILTAGRYYYAGWNPSNREETYKLNPHYRKERADDPIAKWKESKQVKEYRTWYQGDALNENIFKTAVKNEFLKGTLSFAPQSLLEKKDLDHFSNRQRDYGASFIRENNPTTSPYTFLTSYIPYSQTHNKDTKFNYNEHFAKLAFGASIDEIRKGDKPTNLKDKLGGTAVAFRTLINSAINWEYLAKYISNDKKTAWYSLIAPNTVIQARDQNGKIVQPEEFADKFNEQFFVDAQGNKVATVSVKENRDKSNVQSDAERFKSAKFKEIQAEVKKILDKYYEDNKLDATKDKVEWTLINRNVGSFNPPLLEQLVRWIPDLYKALDPRLSATYKKFDTREEWVSAIGSQTSYSNFASIRYDTNNIGAGYDGLGLSSLRVVMVLINSDSELKNSLRKSFPQLVKVSEEFVKFMKDSKNKFKWSVPFDNWKDVESKYWVELNDDPSIYEWKDGKLVQNTQQNQKWTHLSAASAEFFVKYANNLSLEDNIALSNELTNYYGRVPEPAFLINKEQFIISFISPSLSRPYTGTNALWFADFVIRGNK